MNHTKIIHDSNYGIVTSVIKTGTPKTFIFIFYLPFIKCFISNLYIINSLITDVLEYE